MGGGASHMVIHNLATRTAFEEKELEKLHEQFQGLAARQGNPSTITEDEMVEGLKMVGIEEKDSTLIHKVFQLMDKSHDGQVFFKDFVVCCSSMISGNVEEKLKFSFALYATEDGTITKEEMVKVLAHTNSAASWFGDPCMSEDEINKLVEEIFAQHNHDGVLKFADYMEAVAEHPVLVQFIAGKGTVARQASIHLEEPEAAPAAPAAAEGATAEPPAKEDTPEGGTLDKQDAPAAEQNEAAAATSATAAAPAAPAEDGGAGGGGEEGAAPMEDEATAS